MPDTENITLTDGSPVTPDHKEINPVTGQQKGYVVLSAEERAKGFVRPVRCSYVHVGLAAPKNPLRDLNEREIGLGWNEHYAKFEEYTDVLPTKTQPRPGRFWTQAELDNIGKGCGSSTKMSREIAETYARQPSFYGGTFCCHCMTHRPLNEFVWEGTQEQVGS